MDRGNGRRTDGGRDDRGPVFDHVGIATPDAGELAELLGGLLGAPVAHEETFDGMRVVFLAVGTGYLELLEPAAGDDGPIARHIDRRGPGIHHVAVRTPDLRGALDRAREAGVELVDEEPRPGAWGHDVAFCHPSSTGGVLLEFVGTDHA
jgi:methylmalonyl-CoA/ethylmalonyl-CoA epimerase